MNATMPNLKKATKDNAQKGVYVVANERLAMIIVRLSNSIMIEFIDDQTTADYKDEELDKLAIASPEIIAEWRSSFGELMAKLDKFSKKWDVNQEFKAGDRIRILKTRTQNLGHWIGKTALITAINSETISVAAGDGKEKKHLILKKGWYESALAQPTTDIAPQELAQAERPQQFEIGDRVEFLCDVNFGDINTKAKNPDAKLALRGETAEVCGVRGTRLALSVGGEPFDWPTRLVRKISPKIELAKGNTKPGTYIADQQGSLGIVIDDLGFGFVLDWLGFGSAPNPASGKGLTYNWERDDKTIARFAIAPQELVAKYKSQNERTQQSQAIKTISEKYHKGYRIEFFISEDGETIKFKIFNDQWQIYDYWHEYESLDAAELGAIEWLDKNYPRERIRISPPSKDTLELMSQAISPSDTHTQQFKKGDRFAVTPGVTNECEIIAPVGNKYRVRWSLKGDEQIVDAAFLLGLKRVEGDSWKPDHFGEVPRQVDADGQATIFFDDSDEPPEPDDFGSIEEFNQAWEKWEQRGAEAEKTLTDENSSPKLVTQFNEGDKVAPAWPAGRGRRGIVERAKEVAPFWRCRWGLHPCDQVPEGAQKDHIRCDTLPIDQQIRISQERIFQQNWRIQDLEAQPKQSKEIKKTIESAKGNIAFEEGLIDSLLPSLIIYRQFLDLGLSEGEAKREVLGIIANQTPLPPACHQC